MTIPEILKELELYTGRFPIVAMQAAVEQREAITPELLREGVVAHLGIRLIASGLLGCCLMEMPLKFH